MAPVNTTGLLVCSTRWEKKELSSSVSVPWVTTMPSTSSWSKKYCAFSASVIQSLIFMFSEGFWRTPLATQLAIDITSGTPLIRSFTSMAPAS